MLAAYLAYLSQAILRYRSAPQEIVWWRRGLLFALAGVIALAGGAWLTVRKTEGLIAVFGIPQIVGGLFITSTMSVAPEAFKTWFLVRSGQQTAGATSVITDNCATITIGFFPLALAGTQIGEFNIYALNLAFVAALPIAFTLLTAGPRQAGRVTGWTIAALVLIYLLYIGVMAAWVLDLI